MENLREFGGCIKSTGRKRGTQVVETETMDGNEKRKRDSKWPTDSNDRLYDFERDHQLLVSRLVGVAKRDRILHDILPIRAGERQLPCGKTETVEVDEVARQILRGFKKIVEEKVSKRYQGGLFIARYHNKKGFEHIHIVHDCRFSGSFCRCSILHGLSIKRRQQRPRYESQTSEADWSRLTKYLLLQCGGDSVIYVANEPKGWDLCKFDYARLGESEKLEFGGLLEEQNDASEVFCSEGEPGNSICPRTADSLCEETDSGGPGMPKNFKTSKIMEFLFNHLITPPVLAPNTPLWYEDNILCNIDSSDKEFMKALDLYKRKINNKILPEIIEMYKDKVKLYAATDGNFTRKYKNVDESVGDLNTYLHFQFGNNERVTEFLSTLYKTITKNNGKMNAIWLKGPPSSGKSWFVRAVEALMVTVGKCSIMNKTNNFPLSSLVCCNLIVMDELSYDPATYTDTLKLLFGGDQTAVSVKYLGDSIVFKTPVILMSNGDCIPDIEAFRVRVNKFCFQTITHLNLFEREINPMALIEIFKQYGVYE